MICVKCGRNRDCFWEGACFRCTMFGPEAAAAQQAVACLLAEREQLTARIAEIDLELAKMDALLEEAA